MAETEKELNEVVCGIDLKIVYLNGQPDGIRDNSGFILFFHKVTKYTGQDERYARELRQLHRLADFLLEALRISK